MNDLTLWQAAVLGTLQGLGEFLPISSSAHLSLAPWAFHWNTPGLAFDVALHLGTLVALVGFFWAEWVALARAALNVATSGRVETIAEKRVVFIAIATVPAAVLGLLFEEQAETIFRTPVLTATALIVMGALLWWADRSAPMTRQLSEMTWKQALLIGCAQAFALIPGVSRSGSTITAARALSFDRQSAAVFSFLMSMPVITAAAVLKVPKLLAGGIDNTVLVGIAAAAVSSWLAIAVLLRFIQRYGFAVFAVYRFVLGLAVYALVAFRG
ncbi:MAG: undecaprenyl-diphosphate phosphatase [Gemmatimonadota bacterium]|nr:undecaprenyl-diphosphate phosphatase [Gemmatimonadota bacterium]